MKSLIRCLSFTIIFLLTACTALPATQTATLTETTSPMPTVAPLPAELESWGDRSVFRNGLVSSQQGVLDQLPGATVYHIDLVIDPDYTRLQGEEEVLYTNRESEPLEEVYFQLFPNMEGGSSEITTLLVDGSTIEPVYEGIRSALKVPLTVPLAVGQAVKIKMNFEVSVPTQTAGNYGLFAYVGGLLALDGFYPAIPVYDANGWHEGLIPPNADTTFQDASFYLVQVTAPKALKLVAAGVKVAETLNGDAQTVTFAAGPARDFYLAASEQYTLVSQTMGQTVINVYALGSQSEGAQQALDTAFNALQSYSERFAPYPYTEFDIVSIPMDGAYGIEYPGITGINQALFNSDAVVNGTPAAILLESTVAHEIGHQWFYNLVGNDQANEPWLDEAVTQYVTGLYYLDRYGATGWQGYRDSWGARWSRVDNEDKPIGLPAGDYQGREYGAIVYGRGPLFLTALADQIGQDTFDAFLRDYVEQNEWGIGTAAGFKSLAEKDCACDLSDIFNQWVEGN